MKAASDNDNSRRRMRINDIFHRMMKHSRVSERGKSVVVLPVILPSIVVSLFFFRQRPRHVSLDRLASVGEGLDGVGDGGGVGHALKVEQGQLGEVGEEADRHAGGGRLEMKGFFFKMKT